MKALVWHGGTQLRCEEVPDPEPKHGELLLDVQLAGICGSDLHGYRGNPGPRVPPLILGHEAVGTIRGHTERYVPFPIGYCGACRMCRDGRENLCETRGLLGLDRQGVFAERAIVLERSLLEVPSAVPNEAAVLTEPLAVCLSALGRSPLREDSELLVIGCGPLGLLTVYAAAARGIRVTAVEPLEKRRQFAERLGAAETHARSEDVPNGDFDLVVDAVGIAATTRAAIASVRRGGTIMLLGLGANEATLPLAHLVREGITISGHYAYTRSDFQAALETLSMAPVDLSWITYLDLEQGPEGFRALVDEPESCVKVVFAIGDASGVSGGG